MTMFNRTLSSVLSLLTIIAILLITYPVYLKYQAEKNDQIVEIAYRYSDMEQLYLRTGVYIKDLMNKFNLAGVTSVVLEEDTLTDLIQKGRLSYIKGSEILNDSRMQNRSYSLIFSRIPRNYKIQPEYSYLMIDENKLFEFVKRNLQIKLGENRVRDLGWNILEIISETDHILDLPLDIQTPKIKFIQTHGFNIIPALDNHSILNEEDVSYKLSRLKNPAVHFIHFAGDEVLGFPHHLELTIDKLKELNFPFIFQEFKRPSGIETLARNLPDNSIKMHEIPMLKRNESLYLKRAMRAVTERHCRILLLTPYIDDFSNDLYEYNLSFIKRLKGTLEQRGYLVRPISESQTVKMPPKWYHWLSYFIIAVLTSMLVSAFFPTLTLRLHILIWLMIGILSVFSGLFGWQKLWHESLALFVSIATPTVLFIAISKRLDKFHAKARISPFLIVLSMLFLGSLIGALLINNLLFHPNYLLAIWRFRGVKLASSLPLILLTLYLFIQPRRIQYILYILKRYLARYLTLTYLIVFALIILFVTVYVLRTGNYGMLVMGQIELSFREFMEQLFLVRPRTKEILFAYPLLIMVIHFWNHEKVPPALLRVGLVFASITSISMINTFCHLHAPFLVSLYRSVLGLGIGTVLGILLILTGYLINFLVRKIFSLKKSWPN